MFELLSALCVYNAEGYSRALEALDHYKVSDRKMTMSAYNASVGFSHSWFLGLQVMPLQIQRRRWRTTRGKGQRVPVSLVAIIINNYLPWTNSSREQVICSGGLCEKLTGNLWNWKVLAKKTIGNMRRHRAGMKSFWAHASILLRTGLGLFFDLGLEYLCPTGWPEPQSPICKVFGWIFSSWKGTGSNGI